MSVSNARVARHGVQKAEENWTSVTRDPNSVPMSAAEIADATFHDYVGTRAHTLLRAQKL
jgi:hypothetical protein